METILLSWNICGYQKSKSKFLHFTTWPAALAKSHIIIRRRILFVRLCVHGLDLMLILRLTDLLFLLVHFYLSHRLCSKGANHHNHFVHRGFLMICLTIHGPYCRETPGDLCRVCPSPSRRTALLPGLLGHSHAQTCRLRQRPNCRLDIQRLSHFKCVTHEKMI